ncbi:hypothetical protein FHS29_001096 [Saccharothrix tamanrassetensis]|uniref:PPE domain-containing protein n=1 Tax=Saccharothrix tamanrassetensis TaxID=1051531 RepID=A0A841CFP7_9PSEU|nr:hypothetical protein [Saccharothrix tamanrassetensis]MBB5954526.1 hypothetical protein [Saccharothrix tamanrassetensis]
MTGFRQIQDHRFEGYDNPGLANLVVKFSTSDAAQQFSNASHALRQLAGSLAEVDETLRTELRKLGIEWQGAAGDNAGQAVTVSADVATQGDEAGKQNSQATAVQGASYSQSRNAMPDPQALRGDTETSFWDEAGGFFGYETDHAKEVKQTQAAREQVIRGFDQYVDASRDSLNQYQGMTKPSSFEVTTTSSAVSTPVAPVQQFSGGIPGVTGGVPSGVSGGVPGTLPGGGLPGQLPGGTAGLPTQLPGGGTTGITPNSPGQFGTPPVGPVLPGKVTGGPSGLGLGLGLGLAGGTALGLAAGAARGAKVVRNPSSTSVPGGKTGDGPHGGGKGAPGAGKGVAVPGASPLSGKAGISATIGAIDPDEPARGRPGAGGAAVAGKAGAGSMLHPAATAKSGEGEEDGEHIRKYGVDSDDVFGDERMVVQSVIGDELEQK